MMGITLIIEFFETQAELVNLPNLPNFPAKCAKFAKFRQI